MFLAQKGHMRRTERRKVLENLSGLQSIRRKAKTVLKDTYAAFQQETLDDRPAFLFVYRACHSL